MVADSPPLHFSEAPPLWQSHLPRGMGAALWLEGRSKLQGWRNSAELSLAWSMPAPSPETPGAELDCSCSLDHFGSLHLRQRGLLILGWPKGPLLTLPPTASESKVGCCPKGGLGGTAPGSG